MSTCSLDTYLARWHHASTDNRAYQHIDGTGFFFDGVRYQGFPDPPKASGGVRQQIARRAVAHGVASRTQHKLAQGTRQTPPRSELLEIAQIEDAFLDLPVFEHLLHRLTEDERLRVLRPQGFLGRLRAWPMTPGMTESLFPELTANKLRDWDNRGLIQAYCWETGRHEGYFRSQLVVGLLVSKLLASGWSIELLTQELALTSNPGRDALNELRTFRLLSNSRYLLTTTQYTPSSMKSTRSRSSY